MLTEKNSFIADLERSPHTVTESGCPIPIEKISHMHGIGVGAGIDSFWVGRGRPRFWRAPLGYPSKNVRVGGHARDFRDKICMLNFLFMLSSFIYIRRDGLH
jgi:hypothetical protein